MAIRVDVSPRLLGWARDRAGLDDEDLTRRFPNWAQWVRGDRQPTLKQLEGVAQATHAPIGYLFLPEPPEETIPLPDYRTMKGGAVRRPSPDLLDMIYLCEQRQEWYREYALLNRQDPVALVSSLTTRISVTDAADAVRAALNFDVGERGSAWSDALRTLVDHAEGLGVLVMVSGVVGSNTHRVLDPQEFRGFALVDELAPLVFVNGADTKAAQIFTLTHELAHLALGAPALDDVAPTEAADGDIERWCNQVAAEVLVPLQQLVEVLLSDEPLASQVQRLAKHFKVSTLVVLRRLRDAGRLTWDEYRTAYQQEWAAIVEAVADRPGGGDFFKTQPVRVSKRFARAVIASTLEGQTLHRDAFGMLGFRKLSTFENMAARLGVR